MVDDPRDRRAYQIAIAFLGLAVVTAFAGIAWVCAEHWCVKNVPNELWFMGVAIAAVFVGALIHLPQWPEPGSVAGFAIVALAGVAAFLVGVIGHHLVAYAVAVGFGCLLLGLFIPSPGRRDP
jgi:hypothetical protein